MPSLNMPVQRLKVAILPLDLPCSEPVTHSGEISATGKSHTVLTLKPYDVTVTNYARIFRANKRELFARNILKITADVLALSTPHLLLTASRHLTDIHSIYSAFHRRRGRQSQESACSYWLPVGHQCLYILSIAGLYPQSPHHFQVKCTRVLLTLYCPPISVTWLQLIRKHLHCSDSEIRWRMVTPFRAVFRHVTSALAGYNFLRLKLETWFNKSSYNAIGPSVSCQITLFYVGVMSVEGLSKEETRNIWRNRR